MKLSAQDASDALARQVEDLQGRIVELESQAPSQVQDGGSAEETRSDEEKEDAARPTLKISDVSPPVQRLLWVDDRPENNAYEVKSFLDQGWEVITARSTDEALEQLARHGSVDAVISDLGRREEGDYDPDAGLRLIGTVREQQPGLPVLIYTTASAVQERSQELRDNGADAVTDSAVALNRELVRALGRSLEARVGVILRDHRFSEDQRLIRDLAPRLDYVGTIAARRIGVDVVYAQRKSLMKRLRERLSRLLAAGDQLGLDELILVVPFKVDLRLRPEGLTNVRLFTLEELEGFLAGIAHEQPNAAS